MLNYRGVARRSGFVVLSLLMASLPSAAQDATIWPEMRQNLPNYEARITAKMAEMDNADKVGQMVMGEIKAIQPSDLRTIRVGGILNGGGSFPYNNINAKAADWLRLSQAYHDASVSEEDGPQIPVLWGTDAVHGHNNLVGATLFPHNIGLGATNNSDLLKKIGEVVAVEVAASGIFWTFAPTIAVPRNDRWGRTYEGFSEDPDRTAKLGAAMVGGLQGTFSASNTSIAGNRVAATAKHFLGDGGTTNGSDRGNTQVTEQVLRDIHGEPYVQALSENVLVVMASFSSWNGDHMHGHKYLLTDVLKGRMGFRGFVLGDWNGHGAVSTTCTDSNCPEAINAGVDMIMVPNDWRAFYTNTLAAVNRGDITQDRVDEAVRRILRVKFILGLFDDETPSTRTGAGDNTIIGHADHRTVARQAVRESLVLLKNNDTTLPLRPSSNILVIGDASRQIWAQNGGWSVSWQGGNRNNEFPGATSLYDGIRAAVTAGEGSIEYSNNASFNTRPDAAIVVFSEKSYAEWHGDLPSLVIDPGAPNPNTRAERLAIINTLSEANIPVVAVYLGGRPLFLTGEIDASDAFVAAWLPGTEGGGVADVLFCDTTGSSDCDFKGTLPFSWPASASQGNLNVGEANYSPLFAFGYGLDYATGANIGPLPGTGTGGGSGGGSGGSNSQLGTSLFFGSAIQPFQIDLTSGTQSVVFNKSVEESQASADDVVTTRVFDRVRQEDSQEVIFAGGRTGIWQLSNSGGTSDWSNEGAGAAVNMTLQVVKAGRSPMLYSMLCGDGCQATIDISDILRDQVGEEWFELAIPLSCLRDAGASLSSITDPVILHTTGRWTVNVSDTTFDIPPSTAQVLSCQ